jgi:pimeloyl-ACP methyl ester carboxylesterase
LSDADPKHHTAPMTALHEPMPMTLPDGRVLDVYVEGPPEGVPLVSHHGTPGAGLPYRPFVEAAAERGVRWISYARPGYGGSARHEGRTVADCCADVESILDQLGAGRFLVIGGSGGGPHALACAAVLPDRVLACAAIAAVAPWGAGGLEWLGGMGPENIEEFGAALAGDAELRAFLEREAPQLRAASSPDDLIHTMEGLLPEVDRSALTGEFAASMIEGMHRAVAKGIWGWFDDDKAFIRDWGFALEAIRTPVAIWQGGVDKMVPFTHGAWLAARVPNARAHLLDDHGHLSIAVASFGVVLDDLLDLAKERR